ncbi:MAG: SAM-dependent chlorinase/fluorinase [Theionarchaea archaeon]|nr:SAM-dependent chlorinase/fluorinase [Theionarchaea archaeon]MBU7038576.1 SAM-dependent chlorinase/fluorinase [Theionarchaea archaeon]
MFISLLSDFGLNQEYVGVCKAVLLSVCPGVDIVDICHNGSTFDIEEGALMLRNFVEYSPVGVHVAVVDPGVGTERRGIAVETERGDFLVGPDNGILIEAIDRLKFTKAVALENEHYMLHPVSSSFHGRDVFAPAAGYLAKGISLSELGRPLMYDDLYVVRLPSPEEGEAEIRGTVLRVDRFGNLQTNIPGRMVPSKERITVEIGGEIISIRHVKTFGNVHPGSSFSTKMLMVWQLFHKIKGMQQHF